MKEFIEWMGAFLIAFVMINFLCFIYYKPSAWITRKDCVTDGVRRPYSITVMGTEGYGITKLDANGFTNDNKPLIEDGYVLVMGASHTQGKEVGNGKRYTDILNDYIIGKESKELAVYNVASDANYLPSLIKRFAAGIEEFPNASTVILEIGSTNCEEALLQDSLIQVHYNENETAEALFSNCDMFTKIKKYGKEYVPIYSLIQKNMRTLNEEEKVITDVRYDTEEYSELMNCAMELIRSEYDGNIFFVYHPKVAICENGTLICNRDETAQTFQEICEEHNMFFVDTGKAFIEHYAETYEVPYGFTNTTMGTGHLNETGHKILANVIYEELRRIN